MPSGSFFDANEAGVTLCASGIAVPVPNASGYTGSVGQCVASIDTTGAGTPCGQSCAWASGNYSDLPVSPSGNLVCAPVARPSLPCVWLPSSIYDFSGYMASALGARACLNTATGPTGVACSGNGGTPPAGSCAYYRCLATVLQGAQQAPPVFPLWQQYFPGHFSSGSGGPPVPGCVAAVNALLQQWQTGLPLSTACSYALPAPFSANGWQCAAGTVFSLSPSPSAPSTPTGTPTQTVTTGLTPTATPTQTVTAGLTPTASPQWVPQPANAGGSSAPAAPNAGLVAGVVIAAVAVVALAGAVGWWWVTRSMRAKPLASGSAGGGVDLVVQKNPASAAPGSFDAWK